MQNVNLLLSCGRLPFIRCFSTSLTNFNCKVPYITVEECLRDRGYYKLRPHVAMCKLLFKKKRRDPFARFLPKVGRPSVTLESAVETVNPQRECDSKRVRVLNKLFMRYIPEILTTSDIGSELWDYSIEFTRIKMAPQFHVIDVYWVTTGNDDLEKIQKILNDIASPLRTELIRLRLMGLIPKIRFQKEPLHAIMLEVDRRLKIADFGEDYVPTNIFAETNLKKDLQLQIELSAELRKKISSVEGAEPLSAEEEHEIPPMLSNVFGLYRDKIMASIMESMKKTSKVDHTQSTELLIGKSAVKKVPVSFEAQQIENWDKAAFLEFLKNQRIKNKKIIKLQNREEKEKLAEWNHMHMTNSPPEDELYSEFVVNAFPDEVEDDFMESDSFDRFEDEQ